MYATPTELSVNGGGSLELAADYQVAGARAELSWIYNSPIYALSGTLFGAAPWFNTDRAQLDSTFPTNGLVNSWVFATAVPEPSTFAMGMCGVVAVAWDVYRRRRHAGSDSRCGRLNKLR
jgi:hypothetical protein